MSERRLIRVLIMIGVLAVPASGADWGTYAGNPARTGVTDENLEFPMAPLWRYVPAQPPAPAWPEPGRELHRIDFDYAFQPVVSGNTVFFGSSADDTVRAVSIKDGRLKWRFTAGGPVRCAPEVANGRVYVTSDDGFLSCLDSESGELLWSFDAASTDRMLLGNGRMISRRPCRSGALVVDGVVYTTAGMWPSEGVYLYALDAETGKEIWRNDTVGDMYRNQPHGGASAFTGVCPQGYMAVSGDLLLVPSGRTTPAAFNRKTGELVYYQPYLYSVPYSPEGWDNRANGGWWLTIAGDLFFSGMHKGGAPDIDAEIGESPPRPGDGIVAYSLETGLRMINLKDKHRAIVHDGVLYAVGNGEAVAVDLAKWRKTGKLAQENVKWGKPHGRVYSMALAGDTLLVGGKGTITAFRASTGENLWKSDVDGEVRGIAVSEGRLVLGTSNGTVYCFESHRMDVPPVVVSEPSTWKVPIHDDQAREVGAILENSGARSGYALVLGDSDVVLASALAAQSDLRVVCALAPLADVAAARERLLTTGMYGSRIAVVGLGDGSSLPFASHFADLVVVTGDTGDVSPDEIYRMVRPAGGVLSFAPETKKTARRMLREAGVPRGEVRVSGDWTIAGRGKLPGAGEWRYQWADGGRTGIGEQSGVKPPFELLWFGGPGPDRMMPRHWATSPPLCVDGKVFVTAQHDVIAFDAYNGREFWCRRLPGAGRVNAPDRSANFVADDDSLYVASGPLCHRLDQATGKTLMVYAVPEPGATTSNAGGETPDADFDWPELWTVFGPFPKATPLLSGEILRSVPSEITVDGGAVSPVEYRPVDGFIDFTNLYGGYGFEPLAPGQKPGPYPRGQAVEDHEQEGTAAYAFAAIDVRKAGRLTIGAGADWWMQWFLDGKPIFDTLQDGNLAQPYGITNHVFGTHVTEGKHTLAVMVRGGALGWCLVSAGGPKYSTHLRGGRGPGRGESWGYLSVVGDLVLGTRADSRAEEGSGEAKTLFALDKADGRVRWSRTAERTLRNTGIAFDDGRIFLLDLTSPRRAGAAKRLGVEPKIEQTLVGLDLETGDELWRQDDVPPGRTRLSCAEGVVVVNANAAYDANTGDKLWQHPAEPERVPLIYGDWIIAQPYAFHLRTGKPRMTTDLLTGIERPWRYPRAYGCGQVAGCDDMLFFRSGTPGFFDFEKDGTTNIGGVRPGCSVNMVAAAGLMILPESSAGCSCSYNFQTSLSLIPAPEREEAWYVFEGEPPKEAVKELHLNLGAPGDRRDDDGVAWLGFPRPGMDRACPVPLNVPSRGADWYYEPSLRDGIAGTSSPWIYDSGIEGTGTLEVSLAPSEDATPQDYLVRLHFAEPEDTKPGERVFDVLIGGEVVLADCDPAKRAGGSRRAVAEEVGPIEARTGLKVDLVPKSGKPPILSGIEIVRVDR